MNPTHAKTMISRVTYCCNYSSSILILISYIQLLYSHHNMCIFYFLYLLISISCLLSLRKQFTPAEVSRKHILNYFPLFIIHRNWSKHLNLKRIYSFSWEREEKCTFSVFHTEREREGHVPMKSVRTLPSENLPAGFPGKVTP